MVKIDIHTIGPVEEITIAGRLEISSAKRLEVEFRTLLEKKPVAIGVNLERLKYIDSSGISTLLRCANQAGKIGVRFGCYGATSDTLSIFSLSQVSAYLNMTTKQEFMISS